MPLWALVLLVGGAGVALYHSNKKEFADESRALEADLADLPEPLRTNTRQMLFLAQPRDVPGLQVLEATLRTNGFTRAAARVAQKIAQLQQGAAQKGSGPQ